ncbi:MAG: CIA30 family protein [Acidobacteriota bacterium]
MTTSDSILVTDFTAGSALEWIAVNDNVMGGRSRGGPVPHDGFLEFTGATNTQGGGFSSTRTAGTTFDLSEYDALWLRVLGDGRTYRGELRTDVTFRGRGVVYRAEFATDGTWQEIVLPFESFWASSRGRDVRRLVEPLDLLRIRSVGLMIYDGLDGPFRLEVDEIRAVKLLPKE